MEIEIEERDIVDDMQDDLDVCRECTGTWKVACYSAWYPHSQFWNDFLDDGWEDGDVYTLQACCLRFMCGILFCCLAPVWCCKAILFFLCWPCICGGRAVKNGNCNKTYFRFHRSKQTAFAKQRSKPLAYIETAQPTYPTEIPYQFSSNVPPESPIPEIRIETEQENGTYVTSPVDDSITDLQLPTTNGRTGPLIIRTRIEDSDLPPAYPTSESSQSQRASNSLTNAHSPNNKSSSSASTHVHTMATKTMSTRAKGMDNNLYRAVVMEGFQGITGKVTSV